MSLVKPNNRLKQKTRFSNMFFGAKNVVLGINNVIIILCENQYLETWKQTRHIDDF